MSKAESDKHQEWLTDILPQQKRLTQTVENLLSNVLDDKNIDYLSIQGRTKNIDSILDKINKKKYSDPKQQLTDISAVRIITYFESQVNEISKIISEIFSVDDENSLDRSKILGDDKIGYRSVHYVCTLGKDRGNLPEYKDFSEMKFEIQIRTVLQHAWAELAHDRSYKFALELPQEIQRKLNLYSGTLELVDRGFDEIAKQIDQYQEITGRTNTKSLKHEYINSININKLIKDKIKNHDVEISKSDITKEVIEELRNFEVLTIGDLDKLIDSKFIKDHEKAIEDETKVGFLRAAMMYRDVDKYFSYSWNNNWQAINMIDFRFLGKKHGIDKMNEIENEYNFSLMNEKDH